MGKIQHGRTKKRRSGRKGKVKQKNRTYKVFKPPQYTDQVVAKNWNPYRSPSENLGRLGVLSRINYQITAPVAQKLSGRKTVDPTDKNKAIELFDVPKDGVIPKKTLRQVLFDVKVEDQKYMARLMEKYGDDYEKMFWDVKLNNMQYTEDRLRKLGRKFLNLKEEHRRVDVPENVRQLIET